MSGFVFACLIAGSCGDDSSVQSDTTGDDTTGDGTTASDEPSVRYCEVADAWRVLPAMAQPRRGPTAIRLPDGSVLVSGGKVSDCTGPIELVATATVERFDPDTETWTQLPDMPQPRVGYGLLRLDGGDVLMVGGQDIDGEPLAATTRYDLTTASWRPGPPLPVALGPPDVQDNGDLRLVMGHDASKEPRAFRWVADGWVEVAALSGGVYFQPLLPWGDGFIVARDGTRAKIYDPQADAWTDAPIEVAGRGRGWETDVSGYVNASALLHKDDLFVLATTVGAHGEIGQQGVAIRLLRDTDAWLPGAEGPFWGDTTIGQARGFAPGWVLAVNQFSQRGDVYDATLDAWCRTTEAPAPTRGAMIVLSDGSVLFTGGECDDDPPLRWTPW